MPNNYDKIDLQFSWNGDYLIDRNGDLADSRSNQILPLVQLVQSVVASSPQDWEEMLTVGAGLDEFIGEPNTKETAKRIENRIKDSLTLSNFVRPSDLDVKVVPVGIHSVLIIIKVQALATQNNSLEDNVVVISMVFDYQERGIFVLDTTASSLE